MLEASELTAAWCEFNETSSASTKTVLDGFEVSCLVQYVLCLFSCRRHRRCKVKETGTNPMILTEVFGLFSVVGHGEFFHEDEAGPDQDASQGPSLPCPC